MTTKTRAAIFYFIVGAISLTISYIFRESFTIVWCTATVFGVVLGMLLDKIK